MWNNHVPRSARQSGRVEGDRAASERRRCASAAARRTGKSSEM